MENVNVDELDMSTMVKRVKSVPGLREYILHLIAQVMEHVLLLILEIQLQQKLQVLHVYVQNKV